jgi:hypothetical protein
MYQAEEQLGFALELLLSGWSGFKTLLEHDWLLQVHIPGYMNGPKPILPEQHYNVVAILDDLT